MSDAGCCGSTHPDRVHYDECSNRSESPRGYRYYAPIGTD